MNLQSEPGLPVVQNQVLARGAGVTHKSTAEVACPRSMVGRVIGKNGETIKALQTYTGALIQIDQSTDPTRVTISGTSQSLSLAISMVTDICKGTFKGFALLRQLIQPQRQPAAPTVFGSVVQPRPVYAPGYGLIPPSQLYGAEDPNMPGAGVPQVLGARPLAVQLQPGFQYVQAPGEAAPIMVGMPGTMPGHTLTQQMDGTALLSSPVPMRQMPVQQVYNSMSMGSNTYTTQVAYYPQDFSGGGPSEQMLYPQPDGTLISLQPGIQLTSNYSLQGNNTGKVIGSNAIGHGAAGRHGPMQQAGGGRWAGNNTWVDSSKVEPNTMGQNAVNELLGNSSGGPPGQNMNASLGSMNNSGATQQSSSNQQQLVQVIGPEGKVYYLQGSDH